MSGIRGPIVLAGGGKMGGALLEGWLGSGLAPAKVHVVEPDPGRRRALGSLGVGIATSAEELPASLPAATLVIAVKPQVLDAAVPPLRRHAGPGSLVLSIAAGKTIATLERLLGAVAIVRAMPNTPACVGRGASVLCAGDHAGAEHRAQAEALLAAVGEVHWVEDEALMHVVTAMSGGGPAYVFLLIEALAAAAVRQGLPEELSLRLARATVSGSGELARLSPLPADRLRADVTSPGGTTQAALAVLMAEDGLRPLIDRAIAAATRRSVELG
jgi:pyrroline-5-carboxylate reductase